MSDKAPYHGEPTTLWQNFTWSLTWAVTIVAVMAVAYLVIAHRDHLYEPHPPIVGSPSPSASSEK